MKQYDVICPECGTMNLCLYLDETDGCMICENFHAEIHEDSYKEKGIQTDNGVVGVNLSVATGWT